MILHRCRPAGLALILFALAPAGLRGADLADEIRRLDVRVVAADSDAAKELPRMLGRDARARIDVANRRETEAWHNITSRTEWEDYRDRRIDALRGLARPIPRAAEAT